MISKRVGIEVTSACNLRCKMCLFSCSEAHRNELTTDEIKKLIDSFAEMDIEWLGLTGGETLFRGDIFCIINYAKDKGLKIDINTNGTLITSDVAKKLNIDVIQFSIDGLEKTHDWNRGIGTFKSIVEAIPLFIGRGIRVDSNTIITRQNQDELFKLTDMLSNLGVSRFCYSRPINAGRCRNVYDYISLDAVELLKLKLSLIAHARVKGYNIYFDGGIVYFLSGCGVLYRNPFITSNGDVVPCCCFRDKPVVGNIRKDLYIDIVKKSIEGPFKPPIGLLGNCNRCIERLNSPHI